MVRVRLLAGVDVLPDVDRPAAGLLRTVDGVRVSYRPRESVRGVVRVEPGDVVRPAVERPAEEVDLLEPRLVPPRTERAELRGKASPLRITVRLDPGCAVERPELERPEELLEDGGE